MSRTRQQIVFRIQELTPSPGNQNSDRDSKATPDTNKRTACNTAAATHQPSAPLLSDLPPSYDVSVQNEIEDALQEICDEPSDNNHGDKPQRCPGETRYRHDMLQAQSLCRVGRVPC